MFSLKTPIREYEPFTISVVPETELFKKNESSAPQIVSPTESVTEKEVETNFKSDKNSVAEKEQIKRGEGADKAPNIGQKIKAPPVQKPINKTKQVEVTSTGETTQAEIAERRMDLSTKQLDLKLDTKTLSRNFTENTNTKSGNTSSSTRAQYRPFSRPYGSGAQFLGLSGTTDYLPNLPDGDITMLNAKADQYAVFVRRVATQVFSQLRTVGWESMRAEDILNISGYSTVRAVLSPSGELLSVILISESGSRRFDSVLVDATKRGATDPHPPKGAESSDGKIRFIFQSKSWVQGGSNPRTGAPIERRWLLLSTGLE